MSISNLAYKSLDVRYTAFFYYYKFRERDYVGACCNIALGAGCNTLTVEQIVRFLGENRANCDTSTNVGMRQFYSYQIHSVRLVNRKSKMATIFQDGNEQINCTSSSRTTLAEFVKFVGNINILRMLKSPLSVP